MEPELEVFRSRPPDLAELRRKHTELSDLLTGEPSGKPNVYEFSEGTVVSWTLFQGRQPKDPTYGRVPLGHFEFPTEYYERVTVLSGTLEAQVGDKKVVAKQGETITALPQSLLKLDVKENPVYYLCQYFPNLDALLTEVKWHLSKNAWHLTVPEVYDRQHIFTPNGDSEAAQKKARAEHIGEYLFADVQESLDIMKAPDITVSRLEGELRRYGAHVSGHSVRYLEVSTGLVGLYCVRHELQELEHLMLQKLKLT